MTAEELKKKIENGGLKIQVWRPGRPYEHKSPLELEDLLNEQQEASDKLEVRDLSGKWVPLRSVIDEWTTLAKDAERHGLDKEDRKNLKRIKGDFVIVDKKGQRLQLDPSYVEKLLSIGLLMLNGFEVKRADQSEAEDNKPNFKDLQTRFYEGTITVKDPKARRWIPLDIKAVERFKAEVPFLKVNGRLKEATPELVDEKIQEMNAEKMKQEEEADIDISEEEAQRLMKLNYKALEPIQKKQLDAYRDRNMDPSTKEPLGWNDPTPTDDLGRVRLHFVDPNLDPMNQKPRPTKDERQTRQKVPLAYDTPYEFSVEEGEDPEDRPRPPPGSRETLLSELSEDAADRLEKRAAAAAAAAAAAGTAAAGAVAVPLTQRESEQLERHRAKKVEFNTPTPKRNPFRTEPIVTDPNLIEANYAAKPRKDPTQYANKLDPRYKEPYVYPDTDEEANEPSPTSSAGERKLELSDQAAATWTARGAAAGAAGAAGLTEGQKRLLEDHQAKKAREAREQYPTREEAKKLDFRVSEGIDYVSDKDMARLNAFKENEFIYEDPTPLVDYSRAVLGPPYAPHDPENPWNRPTPEHDGNRCHLGKSSCGTRQDGPCSANLPKMFALVYGNCPALSEFTEVNVPLAKRAET